MTQVNLQELVDALEYVSSAGTGLWRAAAYLSRDTGSMYFIGTDLEPEEVHTQGFESSDRYVAVPSKQRSRSRQARRARLRRGTLAQAIRAYPFDLFASGRLRPVQGFVVTCRRGTNSSTTLNGPRSRSGVERRGLNRFNSRLLPRPSLADRIARDHPRARCWARSSDADRRLRFRRP